MCFGTFDNLHPGHLSYLKQAKKIGDYLMVVVARDMNVKKIKGRMSKQNEKMRLKNVKKISFVNKAVLGQLKNLFNIITRYKPDVICLGYDQKVDLGELKKVTAGEIIRLKPYKERIYKSSLKGNS